MQECAKICIKKCKRAKNWKIDFSDVCIFFFWRQSYLTSFSSVTTRQSSSPLNSALAAPSVADFCLFCVPPPSIGVTLVTPKQRHLRWFSATYICRFYILHRKVDFRGKDVHQLGIPLAVSPVVLILVLAQNNAQRLLIFCHNSLVFEFVSLVFSLVLFLKLCVFDAS